MQKTDSIIIVGGGSAGWMTAATLIKNFPNKKITVIESPDLPTVGVGESTLGFIREWLNSLDIKEEDFFVATDASYKLSIKFTDFYKEDSGSFHYPFGIPYFQDSPLGLSSWYLHKTLNPEVPVQDFVKTFFPSSPLLDNNKYNENKNKEFENFNPEMDVAYHFDAAKFGAWLRESYAMPRGVNLVSSTVGRVNVDENGVKDLILTDGSLISADLYIDCTGFKSLLLGETLGEPFISFEDMLPNNRAWATRIPYIDREKEMEPYTNCTAIDNGWVWNIPLWSRIGTGYVYSDKYISPEDALVEFKEYLVSDKMTVPYAKRINDLEFKDIKFKIGIHERTWVKNVVAIGLSAGFIEPLESNGLFTVHEFVRFLCKGLQRGEITQWDRDVHNASCRGFFTNFAQFVALHYALSHRSKSKYWKDISERTFSPELASLTPTQVTTFYQLTQNKMFDQRYEPGGGLPYIATGMHYFPIDPTVVANWELHKNDNYPELDKFIRKNREPLIKKWEEEAKKSPTLYKYLLDRYYGKLHVTEENTSE
jgi:tryptophan halogenase